MPPPPMNPSPSTVSDGVWVSLQNCLAETATIEFDHLSNTRWLVENWECDESDECNHRCWRPTLKTAYLWQRFAPWALVRRFPGSSDTTVLA